MTGAAKKFRAPSCQPSSSYGLMRGMGQLIYDMDRIAPFVQRATGVALTQGATGLGWVKHGRLVAGAIYEGYNGANIWVHLAGDEGGQWLARPFLRAGFAYPFLVCRVQRLWGQVDESNACARRFDEHIGFREVARLKGAAHDGGDVLIYCMAREECRYI